MTGPSLWSFRQFRERRQGTLPVFRMGASVKRPRQFLSISTLISFILISLVRPIVDRLVRSVFIVALAVAQRRTAGQQQQ